MSLEAIVQQVLFRSSTGRSMTIRACSSRTPSAGYSSVPVIAPHLLTSCRYFISLQLEFEKRSQIHPIVKTLLRFNSGKRANQAHISNVSFSTLQLRLHVR